MKQLSYRTLRESGYDGYLLEQAPERVLQFGEGNFLRGFVDYFIDVMNERAGFQSKVAVVRPTGGRRAARQLPRQADAAPLPALSEIWRRGGQGVRDSCL